MTWGRGNRYRFASLCLFSLAIAEIAFAQCPIHREETKQTLTVTTLGDLVTTRGRRIPFRIYSASDGTTARLVMARLDSLEDARQQIDDWIKVADEITCREQHQIEDTQRVSDRILAQANSKGESKTKIFLVIRRDGLECYLIESTSMLVAMQIENLIDQTKSNSSLSPR